MFILLIRADDVRKIPFLFFAGNFLRGYVTFD